MPSPANPPRITASVAESGLDRSLNSLVARQIQRLKQGRSRQREWSGRSGLANPIGALTRLTGISRLVQDRKQKKKRQPRHVLRNHRMTSISILHLINQSAKLLLALYRRAASILRSDCGDIRYVQHIPVQRAL